MSSGLTRRSTITAGAVAAFASLLGSRLAFADEKAVAAEIKKLYGDKAMAEGKIKLDVPEIAENGLVVPVNVEIDSPMTDADYVKAVHIYADGNPQPGIVTYHFTPACGKASAATRMRLAQTQNIVCVAEMSNGALHMAKAQMADGSFARTFKTVKVTIGGCGG